MNRRLLADLLLLHPVLASTAPGDGCYYCVGGIRTLSLAKALLDPLEIIPIQYFPRLRTSKIDILVSEDALMTQLLFSSRSPSDLGELFSKTPADHIEKLLAIQNKSKERFSNLLGFSRNTLFKHMDSKNNENS